MDEVAQDVQTDEEGKRKQSWLTIALVLIVFVVVLLLWRYCVPGTAETDDIDTATVAADVVPDVIGLDEGEAIKKIVAAGFLAESGPVFDTSVDAGVVVFQSPSAGAEAQTGIIVTIDIATDFGLGGSGTPGYEDGTILVPNVVGKNEADAIYTLESAGFVPSSRRANVEPYQKDAVYDQTPSVGNRAPYGSQVVINISNGPQSLASITVPNTIGLTESVAVSRLQAAGLSPQVIHRPNRDSAGKVFDQFPLGGDVVLSGSQVQISIGITD